MEMLYNVYRHHVCHMCIQSFIRYANLSYTLATYGDRGTQLCMVAEIPDDIPYAVVYKACGSNERYCANMMEHSMLARRPEQVEGRKSSNEEWKLAPKKSRFAKAEYGAGGSDQSDRSSNYGFYDDMMNIVNKNRQKEAMAAPEQARLSGAISKGKMQYLQNEDATNEDLLSGLNLNERQSDFVQQGVGGRSEYSSALLKRRRSFDKRHFSNGRAFSLNHAHQIRETTCLLLQRGLPEMWIAPCLECLEFGEGDERFLIKEEAAPVYRWVLRSTAEIDQVLNCRSICGMIQKGPEHACRVAQLYTALSVRFSAQVAPGMNKVNYQILSVTYEEKKETKCLRCASRTIMLPIEHDEGENSFKCLTSLGPDYNNFVDKCVAPNGPCDHSVIWKELMIKSLSEFQVLSPDRDYGAQLEPKRTTPYRCVHLVAAQLSDHESYTYPTDMKNLQDITFAFPRCVSCVLDQLGSESKWRKLVKSFQPTSLMNSLVFFEEPVHVQELGMECSSKCKWVSGLSDPMCAYLTKMRMKEGETEMRFFGIQAPDSNRANTAQRTSSQQSVMPASTHHYTHPYWQQPAGNVIQWPYSQHNGMPASNYYYIPPYEQQPRGNTMRRTLSTGGVMSPSTHYFVHPSELKEASSLQKAIKHLTDHTSDDALWLLQFGNEREQDRKTFQEYLVYCIAAVSNSYVVSYVSSYILTSRFEYSHVKIMCKQIDDVAVKYKSVEMGFLPQPSTYASSASYLTFKAKEYRSPIFTGTSYRSQVISDILEESTTNS